MIKKSAIWFSRLVWAAAVSLVVLLAVYVSLGRYYINYVDDYQQVLLEQIVSYSGLPLSIDKLSGRWSKLSPIFTLDKVQLVAQETGKPVLSADSISIQLDFIGTLIHRSAQIRRLILNGVSCSLQEIEPGKWQLKGYPLASAQHDLDAIADLVLSVDVVELGDARLQLEFASGEDADINVAELSLHHQEDFRRLRLQATLDDSERPLLAIVEAVGDPRDLEAFEARAYLKLDALDLSNQLPAMRALGVELQQAVIDSELWIDWHPGTEIIAQGKLSTPYLDIEGLSGEQLEPLRDLQLSFRMEKSAAHLWKVWIPSFSSQWQGQPLEFHHMALETTGDRAILALPYLSVDQTVKQLLALNLLAEPEQQLIETLAPEGTLRNLHLTLTNPSQLAESGDVNIPRFFIQANLENVSIAAWHGAPGVKELGGYFEAMPLAGMVELDGTGMELEFPHVYHHALQFESLEGQVRWQVNEENVTVRTGPLDLTTEFGTGTGELSLDLPLTKDVGIPLMNLSIGLRDTDARYRDVLLPYVLDQHLLDWLANSIPSGHIIEGGFIYRGSLLPHDHDNRTVQLFFDVEDTALDFHADWPPLYDIDGLVVIDDGTVTANADHASMYSLNLGATTVYVKPGEQGVWVTVDAVAEGEAGGVLDIVNNSMINDIVGGAFTSWSLDGTAKASISLDLPPHESDRERKIDIAVELSQSHLVIPEHRVELDDVRGTVYYNEKSGISAQRLDASLMGKPLQASISQQKGDVKIALKGTVDIADVAAWSAQPALTFMNGETDYSASILIAPNKQSATKGTASDSQFVVSSTLRGIEIELPPPFGKSRDGERAFSLHQPLGGEDSQLTMRLANVAEMELRFDHQQLASGLLVMGKVGKKQHLPGLFLIKGGMSKVDYDEWKPVVEQYLARQEELSGTATPSSSPVLLAASDFKVDQLIIFSQNFDASTVDFRQRDDGFWVSVINRVFDGELFLPNDPTIPMSILLDKLRLPGEDPQPGAGDAGLLSGIDLNALETLDAYIAIADLTMGEESFGSLNFELQSQPGRLQLINLGGDVRDIRIGALKPATLLWEAGEAGVQSSFVGDVDFSDLGVVLKQWNYEHFIESESGSASFSLSWPGRPDQFELAASTGSLSLDLRKGRFLKASNTASGTMKAVGVLNLMNIVRRLKLDFSDLFSKGISYDRVSGSASVKDKQLVIADALEIKSPSSRFNLRGRADLEKAELDMELVATLPVASNLPWVAALAGGLPVAAGVYVASKIFEDQVDRFSSAVYTLSGDWNDPAMKFKRVFDNKKPEDSAAPKSAEQSQGTGGEN